MYATDFSYDGHRLSDYGFTICEFGNLSDTETISAGSKITFNLVSRNHGKLYSLTGSNYEECIESDFTICKDPDIYEDIQISDSEYRAIMRWLNRRRFKEFYLIPSSENDVLYCLWSSNTDSPPSPDDSVVSALADEAVLGSSYVDVYSTSDIWDDTCGDPEDLYYVWIVEVTTSASGSVSYSDPELYDYELRYYDSSFNVDKITSNKVVYGLALTMVTNKPFAYGREVIETISASSTSDTYSIEDTSDEIGYIYPSMVVTCLSSGTLTIANEMTECSMVIDNCSAGEVITVDGPTHIISSSDSTHKLYDDFNFGYFSIGNYMDENGDSRENKITVSIPCEIVLSYRPIIKGSPD